MSPAVATVILFDPVCHSTEQFPCKIRKFVRRIMYIIKSLAFASESSKKSIECFRFIRSENLHSQPKHQIGFQNVNSIFDST